MKRSFARSPYLWAALAAVAVVTVAWVGREHYQAVVAGTPAPDFSARTLDGTPVGLRDYAGKVLLINVWATWCEPCLEEMPSMQRLYERFDGEDFEILAVSIDAPFGQRDQAGRPGGDIATFGETLGLTFPILHDASGVIQRIYQTTGVPESFVVSRNGIIYKKVAGPTTWDAPVNEELIRRLLEG